MVKINIISRLANVDGLIDGRTDAVVSYLSNEQFDLLRQGVEPRVIRPINYGIDFYGDNLFTSEQEIREHPERVASFRRAEHNRRPPG